jgi:hypothetical protein
LAEKAKAEAKDWDGDAVRKWLDARVIAARSEQVVAERGGRELQDDCDKASAEEMVCSLMNRKGVADTQAAFAAALAAILERDEYIWRGVYNDTRFDRHVRSYARKLVKMAKTNTGFENVAHYQ